jgi:hypothetical protein
MARFILIDNNSGYIWGDSADTNGPARDETPVEYARRLDAYVGKCLPEFREYVCCCNNPHDGSNGYDVYEDVGISESIPVITDGQSQEQIEMVENNCSYVGFIKITDRPVDY